MLSVTALYMALTLAAGGGAADPLPWDGQSWRRYVDARAQVAFPVPLTQTLIDARHFANATPEQMTDVLTLSGAAGFELEIGVWQNPRHLPLRTWIGANAAFLRSADTTELAWHATNKRVDAELFEQPKDGQTYGRRTAVFMVGARVFKISCLNRDDPRAEAEFETILEQLEVLE